MAGRIIIEKEQRLGALDDQIVDAHRDEIDADRMVNVALDRELDLGADAVIRRNKDRIDETRRLEIEKAAEAADLRVGARPPRCAHQRLDFLDHGIAGIDIDARIGISDWPPINCLFRRHLRPVVLEA